MKRGSARVGRGVAALAILVGTRSAFATAPTIFGHGATSAALARSDVADPEPTAAPISNAALAATPGLRLRLGYAYTSFALAVDDHDAGVRDVSGVDAAAQFGVSASRDVDLGMALALHVPDAYIARIAFRPATEPQFVLYESALQRMTADAVAAFRWRFLSVGAGASFALDVGGNGTDFTLGQDATGTYAEARADIELPYRVAPIVGIAAHFARASLGATFRGPLGVSLALDSVTRVKLAGNPLNGTTTVHVRGMSGYDPATVDVGTAVVLGGGFTALGAIEYAAWSFAPAPVADVTIDVHLGTVPSQREARFVEPAFRDTLSPRLGLELKRPASSDPERDRVDPIWVWALRAGYALAPSPVPRQTGFTSYADGTRHEIALGGGVHFGRVAGVDLAANAAVQLHVLATREEQKRSDALPYAHYEASGHALEGCASLEGTWK